MAWYPFDPWLPRSTVAMRRRRAATALERLRKGSGGVSPIAIAGRKIAATFWGEAWCRNLEAYSDYANRLPRGRSYLRNGSVVDLRIEAGRVRSLVSGSDLYELDIEIQPLRRKRWSALKDQCAGQIDSLVELLRGSISRRVMEIVTCKGEGLFPTPREISMSCSCPDWAVMCKHVAATLYGVGARLDREPELLFTLRGVDAAEMVANAVNRPATEPGARKGRLLAARDLSAVFGVEIDIGRHPRRPATAGASSKAKPPAKKAAKRASARTAPRAKRKSTRRRRPRSAPDGGRSKPP